MNAKRPTERQCQATIIEAAMRLGWLVHHCRPARTQSGRWATPIEGSTGFVDCVFVGYGRAIFVEFKRHPEKPRADQLTWLAELANSGCDSRLVFVPEGQDSFIQELSRIRADHHQPPPKKETS